MAFRNTPIILYLAILIVCSISYGGPRSQTTPTTEDEEQYDPDNAEEINEICAGCHGVYGEGGGDGTYPRLAGMSSTYIVNQLRAFKSRERLNIPMLPYATERELPEDDIRDISIFLSKIALYTKMPDVGDDVTAYEKLLIAKRIFNVPRVEGDVTQGQILYNKTCKKCHAGDGAGRGKNPPLAGQYTVYLRLQIGLFLDGQRGHKNIEKYMKPWMEDDWNNLFAYLSSVDD